MKITRVIETEKWIIYRRERGCEKWVKLYFAYNKETMSDTDHEFKTITQAKSFIKTN